jgi:hypothetical protein
LAEFFEESDVVIVAIVEEIQKNQNANFAIARVLETWKGPKLNKVRFRASASSECDSSDSKETETVLLFLQRNKSGAYKISNLGQGRFQAQNSENILSIRVSEFDLMTEEELSKTEDSPSFSKDQIIKLSDLLQFLKGGSKPK